MTQDSAAAKLSNLGPPTRQRRPAFGL